MSIVIDKSRALELLDQAVAEKGAEYVDPAVEIGRCNYVQVEGDGDLVPGCIVGYAMNNAGVPLHELALEGIVTEIDWERWCDVKLSDGAASVLRRAQSMQDDGMQWGAAVKYAHSLAAEISEQ